MTRILSFLVALFALGASARADDVVDPHVVVLLAQDPEAPETAALFRAMAQRFPWAHASPEFSIDRTELRAMVDEARRNATGGPMIPDLTRFYRVDDPPSMREAEALARWLSRSRAVESAYAACAPALA